MALIEIPSALQKFSAGQKSVNVSAPTLALAINELEEKFPDLKGKLVTGAQQIPRFISIFVGQDDVKYQDGLQTQLNDKTRVSILVAIAGG
jgi:molybdopterin synthase sulfur carrier subunit